LLLIFKSIDFENEYYLIIDIWELSGLKELIFEILYLRFGLAGKKALTNEGRFS